MHTTPSENDEKSIPADIRKLISLHEDLFEIGLHGPDLFFITMHFSKTVSTGPATTCTM